MTVALDFLECMADLPPLEGTGYCQRHGEEYPLSHGCGSCLEEDFLARHPEFYDNAREDVLDTAGG